jgi:Fe-S-cluster-containing dehydrogenase component
MSSSGPKVLWRSLEEKAEPNRRQADAHGSDVVKQAIDVSELSRLKRRSFLTLSGAISAMAGLPGCIRRPVERIMPHVEPPEDGSPGVPLHYATVMQRRGEALGLLVRSHEGRPTKIEGNPDHPTSFGATDMLAQASVLELYDADRARSPSRAGIAKNYGEFDSYFKDLIATLASSHGAGLSILAEPTNSPTFLRLRAEIKRRLAGARFYSYAPLDDGGERAGARLAFGQPLVALPRFDVATVILSLDCDFVMTEPGSVLASRQFAAGRAMESAKQASMSRLYMVEPSLSVTGANADHRLALPASAIGAYAKALAAELGGHGASLGAVASALGTPELEGVPDFWIKAVAKDLAAQKGRSLVVVGSRQPAAVHALVAAINQALGNGGRTVNYTAAADTEEKGGTEDIMALSRAMSEGKVQALLILGGNPVYDAPVDARFKAMLAKVPNSIALATHASETAEACTWLVPRAHELETWGDQLARGGAYAIAQPLIAPLFNARSDIEMLAVLGGEPDPTGHTLVRATANQNGLSDTLEWQAALQKGVGNSSRAQILGMVPIMEAAVASAVRAIAPYSPLGAGEYEAVFLADNKLEDGRYANNSWLLELPDPITRVTWDNVAMLAPSTARALGISNGDMIRLTAGQLSIEIPAWLQPGQAPSSVGLPLGWGRTRAGRNGNGSGFNVYPLRTSAGAYFASGVKLEKLARRYSLSETQEHDSMEGRPVAIEANLDAYRDQPDFAQWGQPDPEAPPLWKKVDYSQGYQWGMVIDLNTCNGCSACVIACQAENNIPTVGKEQVARGREMHWLRMDRYYAGEESEPEVAFQPIACQHCEEAPCENVCPVNATTHSPEGLNDMAYNRCIGTRYCSNNCPYKVRRFNFFNFNLDIPETRQMQFNPDVTVRFRGVMEKCTYCVQRIQNGKIAAKREDKHLGDRVVTACQQACSSGAIVFGDINDPESRVSKARKIDRNYGLLADIGTHPRTRFLGKVRNPNPEMKA